MNNIAVKGIRKIISSKQTHVNYLGMKYHPKFYLILTKRSLNFPNGAPSLFPLSPANDLGIQ